LQFGERGEESAALRRIAILWSRPVVDISAYPFPVVCGLLL
jgi:hypothetical protein